MYSTEQFSGPLSCDFAKFSGPLSGKLSGKLKWKLSGKRSGPLPAFSGPGIGTASAPLSGPVGGSNYWSMGCPR